MRPDEILEDAVNQDRGAEFAIIDLATGMPSGIFVTVVGPDSETARRSELAYSDEMASLADADGRVSAEHRQNARINNLLRRVVRMEMLEDGKRVAVPASYILRLLRVPGIHQQVDDFAVDRAAHRGGA